MKVKDPRIENTNRIRFRLPMKQADSGKVKFEAIINVGWCKSDKEGLRSGDYQSKGTPMRIPLTRFVYKNIAVMMYTTPDTSVKIASRSGKLASLN